MTKTDHIEDSSAPLIEHLAELRNRLMWSALTFIIGMFTVYPFAMDVFNFLAQPICDALAAQGQNCQLVLISPQEGRFVAINISLFGGLVLGFPVIAYQLWRFVAPGLYRSEKQAFLPFLIASPVLFFIGAAFAHYVVTPIAMTFFLGFADAFSVVTALIPGLADATPGVVVDTTAPVADTGIDIVFQGIQLIGGQGHRRQPRGKPLQGIAQLKDIHRRSLSGERPTQAGTGCRCLGSLNEHSLARLHTDYPQRAQG